MRYECLSVIHSATPWLTVGREELDHWEAHSHSQFHTTPNNILSHQYLTVITSQDVGRPGLPWAACGFLGFRVLGGALNALLQDHSIFAVQYLLGQGFPGGTNGKEPGCQCRRCKRHGINPWVGKIPWRRAWQPIPVFLPGESHGQKSLAGYSPKGCKESGMTEVT